MFEKWKEQVLHEYKIQLDFDNVFQFHGSEHGITYLEPLSFWTWFSGVQEYTTWTQGLQNQICFCPVAETVTCSQEIE
jgi:hypothetical protein